MTSDPKKESGARILQDGAARIPTIREIATACGCDNSTVSRALRNKSCISDSARERIMGIATGMGWRPNPLASAYMTHLAATRPPHYQATLGYVLSKETTTRVDALPCFHRRAFLGARTRAASLGYSLELMPFGDFAFDARRLSRALKSRGIPGVIIHAGNLPPERLAAFDWGSFAAATWGFSLLQPRLHRAAFYMAHGIRMALKEIRGRGYRRIGMVISDQYDILVNHGFLDPFHFEEKHHPASEWLKACRFETSDGDVRGKIRRWLEKHRPQIIFGEKVVWETLDEMKWKVPDDIAYVTVAWSPEWPHIAGIDQCFEIAGANAVDLVSAQLLQNERGIPITPKLVLHEGRWADSLSVPSLAPAIA